MANIKTSKKRVYISKKLKESLSVIREHACTVICAPMGYGKTTVLKSYLKQQDTNELWVFADSSHELFWRNLCDAIEPFNKQLAEKLYTIGFPATDKQLSEFVSILRKHPTTEKSIVVIDDYYLIESDATNRVFAALAKSDLTNFKLVLISRNILCNRVYDMSLRDEIGCVKKDAFEFSTDDIVSYFRLNEMIINHNTADEVKRLSDGWPFVVRLQMLNYASSKDISASDSVDAFIRNDIWKNLSEHEKNIMIKLSVFDEFTLTQASVMTNINSSEMEKYLDYNEYIDYNTDKRLYSINVVYRTFLLKLLAELSLEKKRDINATAGRLYNECGRHFFAIFCFYINRDFESIYALKPSIFNMYGYITKENKQIFMDIALAYWTVNKNGHFDFAIILSFILFLYNERQAMESLLFFIEKDIDSSPFISLNERNRLKAELTFVSAYRNFNDLHKMNKVFSKAASYTNEPLSLIARQIPISLGSPSVLSLFHNECGMLDFKFKTIDKNTVNYYNLTNGHGHGYDTIFKAEVLYNRGEFEGAEALCHKSIYMSESQNQNSVTICALLLLVRLSIAEGNVEAFSEYLSQIDKKRYSKAKNTLKLDFMIDLTESFLYAMIGDKEKISEWLKNDKKIEENTNFVMFCYANIIYGRYLLLDGQYYHFLGISGQILGLTETFSYVMPRIYTYIYIAIANKEVKEIQKSLKFMSQAILMATGDSLYMPFVENYCHIESILDEMQTSNLHTAFIREVRRISRIYCKGLKVIQKAARNTANYGLTARETDVAKLAALRYSNKEIAETLFIAESTVKSNMKMIFNKLGINSRSELKEFFE